MSSMNDLRFSFRNLIKQPLFSLAIILTLGVGIGANTAAFSLIDALVLRPFPIPAIDRMVQIFETLPKQGLDRNNVSPGNFLDWKRQSQTIEELVATAWLDANLSGKDEPERVQGTEVTPGFLKVMGLEPLLGRFLLSPEDEASQAQTMVLSHELWRERFGSDPAIVGKKVTLNEVDHVVVGVAPFGFDYPQGSSLWVPLVIKPEDRANRQVRYLHVLGKLRDGFDLEQARQEITTIATRLQSEYPETNAGRGVNVMSLKTAVIDIGAPAFLALWQVTTLFVLLLACVNVANLLVVRGADRQKEFSLRLALGAGRRRLVRQQLTESLLLSIGGAVVALPLAWLALDALKNSMPAHIRRFVVGWDQIDLDGRVLLITGLATLLTAFVFGLLPALSASRVQLSEVLSQAGRGNSDAKGRQWGRTILVTGEVAIALMLLVASGLSIQGTVALINAEQGYQPDGVMTMQLQLPPSYSEPEQRRQFFTSVLDGARVLPGVQNVGLSNVLPSSGNGAARLVLVEGAVDQKQADLPLVDYRTVSADFMNTMKIPLLGGRGLDSRDTPKSQRVAVISQKMALQLWPGSDPIGRRFRLSSSDDQPWVTVVGICGDVIQDWFFGGPRPTVYFPFSQEPRAGASLVVRTAGNPEEIVPAMRKVVSGVDPNMPLFEVRTMSQLLSDRMIGLRYAATVMGILGGIALLLAAIGIYGLMAYSVGRRTREIGVRMALGAAHLDILSLTLRRTLVILAAGSSIGLLMAWGFGKMMENNLFGTVSLSLSTFGMFTGVLLLVALTAALLPAYKAMKIDPAVALRAE